MNKIAALLLLCTALFAQQKGTLTDTRDGKIYKTVKIGEQVWMAENLNYEAEGSRCYNDSTTYCKKYGRLYNWETAMKACPNGWHLPSEKELHELVYFVDYKEKTSFEAAYQNFLNSNTYKILQKTSSLMWAESAEFIVDEYYREKNCG